MTEIRDAQEAMQNRHEALSKDSPDWNLLLVGMDVEPREIEALALEYATSAWGQELIELTMGTRNAVEAVDLLANTSSAWADGFTIGAMVFLRRLEKATCDPAFAAWKCPECGYQNEPMTSLCHGCSWDSSR